MSAGGLAPRRWKSLLRRMACLGLTALGMLMFVGCYPRINDISTDRDQPPRYLVAPPQDGTYDAAALREPTERGYPDLHNLDLPQAPEAVFMAAVELIARRGWQEAARERGDASGAWRVQVVAVTALLRFKDDVIVAVRPRADGGSTVAMRSKSRVGIGDLGANAKRIRAFLADLKQGLEAPGSRP